jgi:glycosyltransferase involved in cell wall biosynthesis
MTTILHLVPDLGADGAAKQAALVAPALKQMGIQVHVAALAPGGIFAQPLREAGVPVHLLGAGRRYDPRPLHALNKLLAELHPEAVHVWRRGALRWAAALRVWRRFRLTAGDLLSDHRPGNQWDALLRQRPKYVVTATSAERRALQRLGIDEERLIEIPPAVAPALAAPDQFKLRREFDLPAGARIIACAGTIDKGHGIYDAIWTFEILKYVYPDVRLLLIGDGPEAQTYQTLARQMGKGDVRLRITGWRPDACSLLSLAEVVWIPGEFGGRNVALEALAAGRPVVAADRPDLRELIGPDAGLWVPRGDHHEFAKATRRLLDDAALRQKCRDAALLRAGKFTVAEAAARWRRLHESPQRPK